LNGRLWDISKPLFQVCKMICLDRFATLQGAILEMAGQRVEERQDTIEGQIVSVINELSPEELPDWKIQLQDVLEKMNSKRPEGHELTSQYLGRRIKALGFKTRKVHGKSEVLLSRSILQTFLSQYGLSEIFFETSPDKTLPNATYLQNLLDSAGYPGRELIKLGSISPETPPKLYQENPVQKQMVLPLVESGRDFRRIQAHKRELKEKPETIDLTYPEIEVVP